jgi:diguanylate cyclase (GGDEF)-like protein
LFLIYALASLVPVGALGAVLVHGYRQETVADGVRQGVSQAAVIKEMAIIPALREVDLGEELSAEVRQRLQSATELAVYNGSVLRVRVYRMDGRIVFSDDGSAGNVADADRYAFRRAADGRAEVAIVPDPYGGPDRAVHVLAPIIANASGRATGVLELYLPYGAIAEAARDRTDRTLKWLAVCLAGLYAVLALIAWYTTRALRLQAARREYEALHDSLTGLANRKLFRARAADAIARVRRGESGAVVLIDLDHFKEVNDTLGHHAGDELLRVVAQRLADLLRTDDTIARLGGDEFGLVLPRIGDPDLVRELLARVYGRLGEEFMLGPAPMAVEASFGVALYPAHGDDVESLLQHADAAMYQAKRGRTGIAFYAAEDTPQISHRLVLQSELRHALERDELLLHYQPKIDLRDGRIRGVEALVRWAHPTRGLLGPGHFLPTVEQSGLIGPMTDWVLRRALADQAAWSTVGVEWPVAVNVSARNLESPDFPATVAALLAERDAAPGGLHLEITETAVAADADIATTSVRALAALGVAVSIDDFGTGYTSISQLRHLPIAEVKVDRTFVKDLERDSQDRAIVRSVIELAHGIGATVTAEGVEHTFEADWLARAGCDLAQGYLFAKPAPWTDLVTAYGKINLETT